MSPSWSFCSVCSCSLDCRSRVREHRHAHGEARDVPSIRPCTCAWHVVFSRPLLLGCGCCGSTAFVNTALTLSR
eukprot:4773607-Prymnesium_polylepis.2